MDQEQHSELEQLRAENAQLLADKAELRKMLGLVYENIELRTALKEQEGKASGMHVSRRGRSLERDEIKRDTSPSGGQDKKDNFQATCRDPKMVQHYQRVVGEIAFQLDRRILATIFQEYERFYGFLVSNVKEKIIQLTTCPLTQKVDEEEKTKLFERKQKLFNTLKRFGYNKHIHPAFTEYLVNTYGVLKDRPRAGPEFEAYHRPEDLRTMAAESMPCSILENVNIIIDCLKCLAEEDGKPLFM
ncbi:speriolin-like protein [Engystomops pustulosus]|uniref:speriolin-like protein n=1 Tax=Engystomops pustulosus TaxID=76066 RepID=UPI003AFB14F8